MNTTPSNGREHAVLGQKYTFATASLLLGIACYVNLLGVEKAILALVFGWLSLKAVPGPALTRRRGWARTGVVLGVVQVLLLAAVLFVARGAIRLLVEYAGDLSGAMRHGPKTALSVASPDGNFTAYAEEAPSFDPPNQSLFVERRDQRHFMCVAHLAEDVDSIQKITWSPDSRLVVFESHDYLTVTRVSDWQTVRVFLGREWRRSQPKRGATFSTPGSRQVVASVEFGEADTVFYRLEGRVGKQAIWFEPEVRF